jgi:hypothetical protein
MLLNNYADKINVSIIKIKTALALGLSNLGRVFIYRMGVKTGLNPVKRLHHSLEEGAFFSLPHPINSPCLPNSVADNVLGFGWLSYSRSHICWNENILTKTMCLNASLPWFQIPDFTADADDIKGIWETSRFDWLFSFAKELLIEPNEVLLTEFNQQLSDWCTKNPPYRGPNWKCGQEASIRVMHLAMAALMLDQVHEARKPLIDLIEAHLKRISPTLMYAIAQDNNHGTSEAAALYIGGSWLALFGVKGAVKWQIQGLKWLENRAQRLIEPDGSFSQYSMTYHRVMLDTYSMAEVWRRKLDLPEFPASLLLRLQAAANWLYQMIDITSGDAPNLGANDGARLLPLSDTDYRDFRPSIQLAYALFFAKVPWKEAGTWDDALHWLNIKKPSTTVIEQSSFHFENGGYIGLRSKNAFVLLSYPRFRFRPSQSDILHLDFWVDGRNILRDGGTYSYNAGQEFIDYYGGTISHNTIQFDDRDQMPRLSRFLLGAWPKVSSVNVGQQQALVEYADYCLAKHSREVHLESERLIVIDKVSGFNHKAILRWRLEPGTWTVDGNVISNGSIILRLFSQHPFTRCEVICGKESRYYYQETEIPVLEVEIIQSDIIRTELTY